jgi:hypothetical protein
MFLSVLACVVRNYSSSFAFTTVYSSRFIFVFPSSSIWYYLSLTYVRLDVKGEADVLSVSFTNQKRRG